MRFVRVGLMLCLPLVPGYLQATEREPEVSVNCDPLEGPVDRKHCDKTHWAIYRPPSVGTFCMDWSDSPCDDHTARVFRGVARIAKGDHVFCNALLGVTFEYPEYETSQFSDSEAMAIAASVTGDPRIVRAANLARLDVDNDGRPETILQIFTAAQNWRACDYPVYVTLNDSATEVKEGPLNKLMLPPTSCPDSFQPFVFRGKTYFEFRQQKPGRFRPNLLTEVLMIRGGTLHTMCKFTY